MKVLVTGAGGMVGRAMCEHSAAQGDEVLAHDRASLDISDASAVRETLERERPEVVFNCAAWTDVDGCELDPLRAHEVNGHGPEHLAQACKRIGAQLQTISTDYVFDGKREGFYTQRDDPNPESVYGIAKLQGERRAQLATARLIIIRSGWIFGAGGKNFLSRVVELGRRGESLKTISDAYGTPTYALDLVARMRRLAELDLPGVYHIVNSGEGASFKDFTLAAFAHAGFSTDKLEDVSMDSLQRPAPRPRNSRLRCLLSEAVGLAPLPLWQDALKTFVASEATRAAG
ncbi:MAG TPA: dTDP-4-dehydrorhamnose reductase [Pyrinomonadaceae bacterium]|jgi:dTDP-4-dehydrorhamnose reductase|nr:dTDP-4-dehydrorhamnose reductase [Pyrinomonadaceae bacterium]